MTYFLNAKYMNSKKSASKHSIFKNFKEGEVFFLISRIEGNIFS